MGDKRLKIVRLYPRMKKWENASACKNCKHSFCRDWQRAGNNDGWRIGGTGGIPAEALDADHSGAAVQRTDKESFLWATWDHRAPVLLLAEEGPPGSDWNGVAAAGGASASKRQHVGNHADRLGRRKAGVSRNRGHGRGFRSASFHTGDIPWLIWPGYRTIMSPARIRESAVRNR